MDKTILSIEELQKQFKEQLEFLNKSAKQYDEGDFKEAKRMSVALRNILHQSASSTPLVKSLKLEKTEFFDCVFDYNPGFINIYHPLISVGMLNHRYCPVFDIKEIRTTPYEEYWTMEIVLKDKKGNKFTRKDIVCYVAEQDGGAHVDPNLNTVYYELSRNNSLDWRFTSGTVHGPIEGAELAMVRQIGHEVLKTFLKEKYKYNDSPQDIQIFGVSAFPRVGRNDPCPCGAKKADGKPVKYKRCHGFT